MFKIKICKFDMEVEKRTRNARRTDDLTDCEEKGLLSLSFFLPLSLFLSLFSFSSFFLFSFLLYVCILLLSLYALPTHLPRS